MPVRGDISSIARLKSTINALPKSVAHDVAQRAAPAMTELARGAYDSGQTVYGESRPAGAGGQALTLKRTGAVERALRFVANGTVVRCVLGPVNRKGVEYAKYLIGKYSILPNGGLPAAWSARLRDLVHTYRGAP